MIISVEGHAIMPGRYMGPKLKYFNIAQKTFRFDFHREKKRETKSDIDNKRFKRKLELFSADFC